MEIRPDGRTNGIAARCLKFLETRSALWLLVAGILIGILVTAAGFSLAMTGSGEVNNLTALLAGSPTATPTSAPTPRPSPTSTPTPAPTATDTPKPPPPTPTPVPREPVTKVTKMGIGVYVHGGGHVINTLLRAQPTVLLLQDPDITFAREVRYWFPKAFIVGRIFLTEQPLDDPERRGAELADRVAQLAVPLKGVIDAWQGYNEPVGARDYAGYQAYNKFQVAFARRLQDHYGIPAVAGNDPPGAIEPSDYPKYFGDAIRVSRYFGVHSYGAPDADTFRTPDAIYYGLRHRLIHDALEAAGIKNVQMVITEVGLHHGWRYKISEEAAAAEYMWLADEMEKDRYVIGMAIFGLFTKDDWVDYNIMDTGILDLIGQYQPRSTSSQR